MDFDTSEHPTTHEPPPAAPKACHSTASPHLLRAPTREYATWLLDSRRWSAFEPRHGDVVIATFAKTGTNWMTRIVDLLVFQTPEARPVQDTCVWLDSTAFAPLDQMTAKLAAQRHRRFLKTHLPLDALPVFDSVKYIHVARDGRDVCLSLHNHFAGLRPEARRRLAENAKARGLEPRRFLTQTPPDPREFYLDWIADAEAYGGEGDLPYFEFETTYWAERARSNLLLVHFNDLKADLAGEVARIAEFLEIEIGDALLAQLAAAAEFTEMKRQGDLLMPAAQNIWDRGADRFLNKGEVGAWRDVLTEADSARYEALASRKWTPAQAAWIANGRAAPLPGAQP